ncbi:MAG: hypothetical protein WA433_13560 [Desulfobaccales bacterium]
MNQSPDIPNLVQRLRKLERQSRILKVILGIILIFIGAIFLMGQTSANKKIIAAEGFLLLDNNNQVRGKWGVGNEGSAYFLLNNKDKANMSIQVFPDGEFALATKDNNGKIIILLGVANGESTLQLNGKDGNGGISIRTNVAPVRGNNPGLLIADTANKKRVVLSLLSDNPSLFLCNKDEKPQAMLSLTSNGKPFISLTDKEGKEVFEAPQP